ncbi:MAG: hypothetical protein AB1847_21445 [bacterium]
MSLRQLPVRADTANYEFKIELDGTRYILAFRFNTRAGRWIMDVKTGQGVMLVAGIALLAGVDLLAQFRAYDGVPQGNLFLLNIEDENISPGRNDLGANVLLLYRETG